MRRRIKNLQQYKEEVKKVWGNKLSIIGDSYKNTAVGVFTKCNVCGYGSNKEWCPRPANILNHHGCPLCDKMHHGENQRMSDTEFRKQAMSYLGKDYQILGHYVNADTPVRIKHLTCGYDKWRVTLSDIRRGVRCPKCRGVAPETVENFREYVHDTTNGHYQLFSKVIEGNNVPVLIKHLDCNSIFPVSPHSFKGKNGTRCPICNESSGERYIRLFLEKLGIKYEVQKRFDDCRYKRTLPFDFYIPKLGIAIEYDGIQHFKWGNFYNTKEKVAEYRLRDHIKDWFCMSQGIYLIRIPYTVRSKHDIEVFLKSML